MMGRNYQQPVRPCPQPRTENNCPTSGLSKEQLLRCISVTGFACTDACLYLDTHPEDREALDYFDGNNRKYQEALHEYSKTYGPLTLAHVHQSKDYWKWIEQPWPWQ